MSVRGKMAIRRIWNGSRCYAVATNSGPRAMHRDPFQIRRIAIFPRTDMFGLWRKIRGNYVFRKT